MILKNPTFIIVQLLKDFTCNFSQNNYFSILNKHETGLQVQKCKVYSRLIFFLRRGQTMNQTAKAVTKAQPSEMQSVPHHGTLSKPSTVHTRQGHERELCLR